MSHSRESHNHAQRVLTAMREVMETVPPEYKMSVVAQLYLTIGKRYHKKTKEGST
jgi:hypothetical protein